MKGPCQLITALAKEVSVESCGPLCALQGWGTRIQIQWTHGDQMWGRERERGKGLRVCVLWSLNQTSSTLEQCLLSLGSGLTLEGVCACVQACVCACVQACVCACVRVQPLHTLLQSYFRDVCGHADIRLPSIYISKVTCSAVLET